jgi:hypothetical protein
MYLHHTESEAGIYVITVHKNNARYRGNDGSSALYVYYSLGNISRAARVLHAVVEPEDPGCVRAGPKFRITTAYACKWTCPRRNATLPLVPV